MHLTDTLSYLPSGAFDVGLPGHAPYYCLETCLARDFWSWLGAGVWVVRGEYEGVGGVQSFGGRGGEGGRQEITLVLSILRNFIRQRKEHVQVGYSYAYSNVLLFYAFKIKNGELFRINNCYYVCE